MLVQLVARGRARHFTSIFSGTVYFLGRLGLSVRGYHTHGGRLVPLLLDSEAWTRSRPVDIVRLCGSSDCAVLIKFGEFR